MPVNAEKVQAGVATHNLSTLPYTLRDYANQLQQIRSSLLVMAKEAGEYKTIVSRMATNVHSTSTVLRAASHVINSMESHKEHEADRAARIQAKAIHARR